MEPSISATEMSAKRNCPRKEGRLEWVTILSFRNEVVLPSTSKFIQGLAAVMVQVMSETFLVYQSS